MRFSVKRLLGVSALSIFLGLGLAACSGQQQTEEGVEVSEQGDGQGADNQGGDSQAAENGAEANAQAGNQSEEVADAQSANGTETADAAPSGSENDLQEIIQEMNSQPAADTAAAPADAAAQAAPADAAAAVPQQAAAAPVAAPEAAPAQQAAAPASAPAANSPAAMPFQPGGTPAAAGLPEIGSKMAYVVEQGDTLGRISRKIYGTPSRWNELASLSGITNPSRIFPGDVVYYTLDEKAVSFAQAYESTQRMEIQVGNGETLATLAKRVYGNSKAWRAIWRQNDKIDNPDVVPPGTVIYYMPTGSSTATINKIKNNIAQLTNGKIFNKTFKQNKFNKIQKEVSTNKSKSANSKGNLVAKNETANGTKYFGEIASLFNI
jgi:nucleoid-associated protein YgaU